MSFKYTSWVWSLPLKHANLKIVLLAIADYANDEGIAWPGYDALMRKTELSKASLSKWIRIAVDAGLLEKKARANVGKGRKANLYKILLRDEPIDTIRDELIEKINKITTKRKKPISSSLALRKNNSSNQVSSSHKHELPNYTSEIQPTNGSSDQLNQHAWNKYESYIRHRRLENKMKVSLEETKLLLISYGGFEIQQQSVDKTIENQWVGLYPVKKTYSPFQSGDDQVNEGLLSQAEIRALEEAANQR